MAAVTPLVLPPFRQIPRCTRGKRRVVAQDADISKKPQEKICLVSQKFDEMALLPAEYSAQYSPGGESV